jgi:hypothetical protein
MGEFWKYGMAGLACHAGLPCKTRDCLSYLRRRGDSQQELKDPRSAYSIRLLHTPSPVNCENIEALCGAPTLYATAQREAAEKESPGSTGE